MDDQHSHELNFCLKFKNQKIYLKKIIYLHFSIEIFKKSRTNLFFTLIFIYNFNCKDLLIVNTIQLYKHQQTNLNQVNKLLSNVHQDRLRQINLINEKIYEHDFLSEQVNLNKN